MKKYIILEIINKEVFRLAFKSMMTRLIAIYPQEFTLNLNNQKYRIRSYLFSNFMEIKEGKDKIDLELHIS